MVGGSREFQMNVMEGLRRERAHWVLSATGMSWPFFSSEKSNEELCRGNGGVFFWSFEASNESRYVGSLNPSDAA